MISPPNSNIFRAAVLLVGSLLAATAVTAQTSTISSYQDPVDLVRKAVQNEIKASDFEGSRFEFRGTKTTPKGSVTKIYVETKDATAGLAIAYDGKPLTDAQRKEEEARVERFAKDRDELRMKHDQEHENAERSLRITRALPDAFLFEYVGEEIGSSGIGKPGGKLAKLSFRPNPKFEPPSRVEEVLVGMQGFLLIDTTDYRLASIDGTLFQDVRFGWGILGHLDRGGRFIVNQQKVGDHAWEISSLTLNFTGKIMMLKNLVINSSEVFSDFKRVPVDLTFSQGLELIKKEENAASADSLCCQENHTGK